MSDQVQVPTAEATDPFTFGELRRRTVGLTGNERKQVCDALPDALQSEASADLAARRAYCSDRDFEELDQG